MVHPDGVRSPGGLTKNEAGGGNVLVRKRSADRKVAAVASRLS